MSEIKNKNFAKRKDHLGRNFFQKILRNLTGHKTLSKMELLLARAKSFGLPQNHILNAEISLDYNEPEDAFVIIVEQLNDLEIKIDDDFFNLAMEICEILKLEKSRYQFLRRLI